jgi:tRNA pseudouridine38-40 synthase
VIINREINEEKLRAAINANVDKDVRVLKCESIDEAFHARYSATGKTYVYRILNGPVISPFWVRYAFQEVRELDLNRMLTAGQLFLGEHDWTAFSAAQSDVENRMRRITTFDVCECNDERAQGRMIEIKITANGFLRYMVRTIAGALMAVGRGEIDSDNICRSIDEGVRLNEMVTAPAHGLTLLKVQYGRPFQIYAF